MAVEEMPPGSAPAPEPSTTPTPPVWPVEAPKPSRKRLLTAIILVVVIAAGVSLAYVGTQTNLFHPSSSATQPQAGYTTYSNYGFSFQYPKTWTITEKGLFDNAADSNSGIVIAENTLGQNGLLTVAWTHSVTAVDPGTVVPSAINGFQNGSGGTGMTMGMSGMMTTKAGYSVYYQPFSMTVSGTHMNGVWSAWYSTHGQRLYQMSIVTSGQDAMSMYSTCLSSFTES